MDTKNFTILPIKQTITIGYEKVPVYAFNELSDDVQQGLIDDFDKEVLMDDFFDLDIEFYTDEIKENVKEKYGLDITFIPYDLSYTQGSGATFVTDTITDDDLKQFLTKSFPAFVQSFKHGTLSLFCECFSCEFVESRYSSYNNVNWEMDSYNLSPCPRLQDYLDNKAGILGDMLEDFSSSLSSKITNRLYSAYEYSVSDERVEDELSEQYYLQDGTVVDTQVKKDE